MVGRTVDVDALRRRHPLGEAADQLEPVGVEVDQHDLGAGEVLALLDEARHRPGAAGGPAADVGDLQPCHPDLHALASTVPPSRLLVKTKADHQRTNAATSAFLHRRPSSPRATISVSGRRSRAVSIPPASPA